jgi:hypothetical protein
LAGRAAVVALAGRAGAILCVTLLAFLLAIRLSWGMNMHAQNGDIQLSAEVSLTAGQLVLSYRVDNIGGADIYLMNKVYKALPKAEIDKNFAYVFLTEDGRLAIEKDIPPVPAGLSPTSLVVPYMTVVRAGKSFAETVELTVPVRQYIEYLDNTPPADPNNERVVTANGCVFSLGYFVRPPGATERFEQALGEEVVLFQNPPNARARHDKLVVGPFPIEAPVYAR